jgi:hypothetical protein
VADFDRDENTSAGGMSTMGDLHITWDATNFYLAVSPPNFGVTVNLDTQVGGTATSFFNGPYQIVTAGSGYKYACDGITGGGGYF